MILTWFGHSAKQHSHPREKSPLWLVNSGLRRASCGFLRRSNATVHFYGAPNWGNACCAQPQKGLRLRPANWTDRRTNLATLNRLFMNIDLFYLSADCCRNFTYRTNLEILDALPTNYSCSPYVLSRMNNSFS